MLRAPNNDPLSLSRLGPAPLGSARLSRAAIVSIAAHVVLGVIFWAMPDIEYQFHRPARVTFDRRKAVKLVAPRMPQQLTQKDPNQGKVRNEIDAFSAVKAKPAPRVFQGTPSPRGPAPQPAPQPIVAPPQIEVSVNLPQIAEVSVAPSLPRPQPAPPKLEDVAPPSRAPGTPNPVLAPKAPGDITKAAPAKAGGPGGGITSNGESGSSSALEGMQLLSDPKNVDFRPYLQQVAERVRLQWSRLGPSVGGTRTAMVHLYVDRQGQVPKMVITKPSGVVVFDQAAVASIGSAAPFPPLPREYTGTEIQIQLTFTNYRVR